MGTLKPGATYVYERIDNITYAREIGPNYNNKQVVGYEFNRKDAYLTDIVDRYYLETEWAEILQAAKTNKVLQDAVDRVKILYHLSKQDEQRDNTK